MACSKKRSCSTKRRSCRVALKKVCSQKNTAGVQCKSFVTIADPEQKFCFTHYKIMVGGLANAAGVKVRQLCTGLIGKPKNLTALQKRIQYRNRNLPVDEQLPANMRIGSKCRSFAIKNSNPPRCAVHTEGRTGRKRRPSVVYTKHPCSEPVPPRVPLAPTAPAAPMSITNLLNF
jgi:hypothetical protein